WLTELTRATAALSLSMIVVAALTRLLNIHSPAVHRWACFLVLLQGWLLLRPTLELPWAERPSTAAAVSTPAGNLADNSSRATTLAAPMVEMVNLPSARTQRETKLPFAVNDETSSRGNAAHTDLAPPQPGRKRGWRVVFADSVLAGWLLGVLAAVVILIGSYWRFVRSLDGAQPITGQWLDEWRQVAAEDGSKRPIELRLTAATGPLVCWAPRGYFVLVPENLWTSLSAQQRLVILRHELAHYRRGDLWKSLAVRLLAALHWFNPCAWWAARRFDEAAEWACDALAQQSEHDRIEYAKVLMRLCRSNTARSSLAAAAGGRTMAARLRRVLFPAGRDDAVCKKLSLACCLLALMVAGWVRIEFVAPLAADESPPLRTAKAPEVVDVTSLIDVLAKHEAKFATFHLEYVSSEQRDDNNAAAETEERVEFARDAKAGRWFRKATTLTNEVRTAQEERYTEQNGKRALSSSQTNWNGLNPPSVVIYEPSPGSRGGYDAEPLFALFPNNKPISSQLKGQRVSVEVIDGDAVLRWATTVGPLSTKYKLRLSREHGLLPIEFEYRIDGLPDAPQVTQWNATHIKQAGKVWYAAEGEMIKIHRKTYRRYKVARFDLDQPIPDEAMHYDIPAGSWVHDRIAHKQYIQARPSTEKIKPFTATVLDVGGNPIDEAEVKISLNQASRDQVGRAPQVQLTDGQGLAHFGTVPDDMIYVEVSKPEMRPAAIIVGSGNQLRIYLTPRTKGTVVDIDGRKSSDAYVVVPSDGLDMSGATIAPRPAWERESCAVAPNGTYEFVKELTLRRLDLPLLFVAYSEQGARMAVRTVMPEELGEPLDFLLEPAALVTAELQLPAGTSPTQYLSAAWRDDRGLRIGSVRVPLGSNEPGGILRGTVVGRLPPGKYELLVVATPETERLVFTFAIDPDQEKVELGAVPLRPSKFASLRGKLAPELVGAAMPPSELKPLSALRGKVVVLNFWHFYGSGLNNHPEQAPFFTLPAKFEDQPVHWIAIHDHAVNDADALAAKVAEMRKALWGEGPAAFTAMIDAAEPIPESERGEEARRATDGWRPGTTQGVTAARYGVFARLVLIDRQGRVVGSYTQEELEPALRWLLESGE
ncbi:MAG TPA: M56 family metallopeptidase, partial [Pirellulales bacterium]|nr:M56 family metallopeptidase [Pirellulales bacterium]